jgi:uncharacterized protein (TIGR02996 family)
LEATIDGPEDDASRRVYADWLEEHGRTEADRARAEFIRLQCELARLGADDPRRPGLEDRGRLLWQEHADVWLRFEQVVDTLGRTTDATIRMQQDLLKEWVSLCSAEPKRWAEIAGELFKKQHELLEAQLSAGLRLFQDDFLGRGQDLGELLTKTAALWQKACDCVWQAYDFQVRGFQSAVVRGTELMTKPAAVPSCSAPPGYRDTADSGLLSLPDGATVQVCLAGPEHQEALGDFFGRLSPESRLRRFFTLSPPPREVIDSLCDCSDPRSGLTLVATRTEGGELRIIATGSYRAKDDRTAEVSLAVEDASQGQGLGPLLLGRLALLAVRHGFTHFWAVTHADNQAMRKVFQKSGFALEVRPARGEVLEVDLDLTARRARGRLCWEGGNEAVGPDARTGDQGVGKQSRPRLCNRIRFADRGIRTYGEPSTEG